MERARPVVTAVPTSGSIGKGSGVFGFSTTRKVLGFWAYGFRVLGLRFVWL